MRSQHKDEDRKDYMLLVAAEYIRENCPDGMIFYDDAECDGGCVSDDCYVASDSYLEERG
jgi:hypothetical protein